jgi:hypothetical protein
MADRLRESPVRSLPVMFRSMSSLTDTDLTAVTAAVHRLARDWCVDAVEDYNGELLILITPASGDDDAGTFVLFGAGGRVRVGLVACDRFTLIGVFRTIDEAIELIGTEQARR